MSFPTKSDANREQVLALLQNQQLAPVEQIRQALQPGNLPDDTLESFTAWCLQQAQAVLAPGSGVALPDAGDFRRLRRDLFDAVWRQAQLEPVAAWTAAWQSVWTTADEPTADGRPQAAEADPGAPTYFDVLPADAAWLAAWTAAWLAGKQAIQQCGRAERPAVWAAAWTEAWTTAWTGQVAYLIAQLEAEDTQP